MTARAAHAQTRIGISGWTYQPWRGTFYPPKLPQKNELAYAAGQLTSIEINGTFYGLQKPPSFAHWRDATPDNFVFSIKAPRFITHIRRLRDVQAPIANFLASGLLGLAQKLGPILWQFPPTLKFDPALFETFFASLPHDTKAAATMAAHHDARLNGRALTATDALRPLRHAVEIRHESFRNAAFITLLRKYKIALVCADTVEWPRLMDVTADFIYCRLHGAEQLYASGYNSAALHTWATRIRAWAAGSEAPDAERAGPPAKPAKHRDVFVYFDNDLKILAPKNARELIALLAGQASGSF